MKQWKKNRKQKKTAVTNQLIKIERCKSFIYKPIILLIINHLKGKILIHSYRYINIFIRSSFTAISGHLSLSTFFYPFLMLHWLPFSSCLQVFFNWVQQCGLFLDPFLSYNYLFIIIGIHGQTILVLPFALLILGCVYLPLSSVLQS